MQLCEGIWISIRQKEHQQTNQQEHLVLPASLSSLLGLSFHINCSSLGALARSPTPGYCPNFLPLPIKHTHEKFI